MNKNVVVAILDYPGITPIHETSTCAIYINYYLTDRKI